MKGYSIIKNKENIVEGIKLRLISYVNVTEQCRKEIALIMSGAGCPDKRAEGQRLWSLRRRLKGSALFRPEGRNGP